MSEKTAGLSNMYVNRSLIPTSIKSKVEEWDVFSSITNDYQCCDDQECRTLTVFGRKTWLNPNFRPFFDKNVCKHRKFEKIVLTRSERSRTFDTFFDQGRNVLGTFISYIYILYSVHCVHCTVLWNESKLLWSWFEPRCLIPCLRSTKETGIIVYVIILL